LSNSNQSSLVSGSVRPFVVVCLCEFGRSRLQGGGAEPGWYDGGMGKNQSVPTVPAIAAVEATRTKASRAVYDAKMHKQFEENMRMHTLNPNTQMEAVHLKPFTDHGTHVGENAEYEAQMEMDMAMERRSGCVVGFRHLSRVPLPVPHHSFSTTVPLGGREQPWAPKHASIQPQNQRPFHH